MSHLVHTYVYRNRNPYKRPCKECRQWIGHTFKFSTQPRLPRHPHCYCYYEIVWSVVSHGGITGGIDL